MSRAKTLTVTRPSPSTTAYTVSNASIPRSTLAILLHRLTIAFRILLAILCVCVILGQYRGALGTLTGNVTSSDAATLDSGSDAARAGGTSFWNVVQWLLAQLERLTGTLIGEQTAFGRALRERCGNTIAAWLPLGAAAVGLWMLVQRGHVEEQLLLLSSLGLQTSTSSPYALLSPTTRFIPTSQIRDILIHEAFRGFEVRYYLVVIVEGERDAVVVFGRTLPGRKVLEEVWRGARGVLWGREGRKGKEKGRRG